MGAPVAYVQQILVKSSVSPWHKDLLAVDVFRSPLSRAFQLVEEIRNHVLSDRYPGAQPSPAPLWGGACPQRHHGASSSARPAPELGPGCQAEEWPLAHL